MVAPLTAELTCTGATYTIGWDVGLARYSAGMPVEVSRPSPVRCDKGQHA